MNYLKSSIKIIIVLFALTCFGVSTSAGTYPKDTFSDLALIYQGGSHRPDWTEAQLTPYVTHTFADGHTDWFFDSFLFLEFTDNWQIGFGYKYGARNARKYDWEWLLNRIFERGKSLDALNTCIENNKKKLGSPAFKHKIVLSVVSPITDQTDWGTLNGETLDFSKQEDQIKAAKWYIDQLMSRYKNGAYHNLELAGFYWIEESTAKCGDLPKYISEYIHQLGLRFYWIPYWQAKGYDQWEELGFDVAFLQPNYFFNKEVEDGRVGNACRLAKSKNMALELEFDGNVLFEKDDSYYERLENYINAFEKFNVFENSVIAYYSGTRAILDMSLSSYIENTLILDRIANHILKRRVQSGVSDIEKSIVSVVGGKGEIRIVGNVETIEIFNINGAVVSINNKHVYCVPGIYIVVVDGTTKKIVVR